LRWNLENGHSLPALRHAIHRVSVLAGKKESGTAGRPVSRAREAIGYFATFMLAIYGGFFSGGYVTMLTAVFVFLFGLTFLQ
jgi:hypothetical protein